MKLDEAIEIKETELEGSIEHTEEELREADKLGIEAMKVVKDNRSPDRAIYIRKLPGETKE